MPKSAYAMYKAAFREQKRAPIMVSMTTYCQAYVLDMDQWYTAHTRCHWPSFYHPRMVASELHMRTDGYDDARSGSSHQCPKLRQDPSDDRLFPISPQPIPMMAYAETQLYEAKAEPNYVSNQRLQLQSRITNASQLQFGDPSYTATEPQWQSTINIMEKSSTKQRIFKEGDSRVYTIKSHRQVEAHREAVYRDTHREIDRDVYADQDSTEAAYRERAPMKSTGWSPKRTSNHDYRVVQHLRVNAIYRWLPAARDILHSMWKHCTKAQESAGPLELVKYNHFREAYVLDVDEWDATTHDAIDVYDWWSPMATNDAGSGSSHRCQVMSRSSTIVMIPTKNHAEIWTTPRYEPRVRYWMARWMPDEFGSGDKEDLRSETWERRIWVNRVSELGTGGKVINWAFLSSVSSLLSSSPYFITSQDLGPVQMASARVFTTSGSQPSGGGVSRCAGSTERLPYGANR
jgi:hypothetical protein